MLLSLLKPTRWLSALALAISIITIVLGSDNATELDEDFRRQLPEVLNLLCPYDKTCRGGKPRLQLNKDKESCCTECSCEDSCGLTISCCYPEQAAQDYFDRSHQQCEIPSTFIMGRMTSINFYMVTNGYGNGSREDCGIGNVTCGENEAASVLGSLYPVSSKTTSVIYKNEQCARCHSVARSDMVPWVVEMTCWIEEDRLDTLLQSLETGRVNPACKLDFYYPGPKSDVNVHICYEHTVRSCLQNDARSYYLPSYLNMTDDDVRNACLTGPQAQFGDRYNLFCHFCRYGKYNAENQCMKKVHGARAHAPGTFSALLDRSFLKTKAFVKKTDVETEAQTPSEQMACKRLGGLPVDADDCRPALCPSGKIRLGTRRQCVYPDKTFFSRHFKVAVELYPGNNTNIAPLIDHLNSNLQQDKDWRAFFSAPGLNAWRLSVLCHHDDTEKATNNGSAGFFWLKLTLEKTKPSSLANILANVDKFMTGDWDIIVNGTSVPLEQRFSEFEDVSYDKITSAHKQRYADSQDPELSCTSFDRTRSHSIHVTKTFFCDQVSLQPEEYVMDKGSKRLYVNVTGRVFSQAEYSLGYDARGDPEPRLCLGDTDYVLVPQQKSASPIGAPPQNDLIILALVMIAQLI